ncbi:DUF7697 family protein [Shumkonia mesophila]|uniref:DUF7697 family protein n=1 Tax=Shumkonia mesophila TaxID=2838854 RepID=UPI0029349E14|nr:hypothetical protein [Shumkonia mesophila]
MLSSHGQLRVTAGGAVIGLDMAAALAMAGALGLDGVAMAELLPYGEAGMVRAMNRRDGDTSD